LAALLKLSVRSKDMNTEQNADSKQNEVSLTCSNCKHQFVHTDMQSLVAPKAEIAPTCPKCSKPFTVASREIGCPGCQQSFWVAVTIMGNGVKCPHCQTTLPLPTEDQWKELEKSASGFRWTIVSSATGKTLSFDNLDSIGAAIAKGDAGKDDECTVHKFAPKKKFRELCDKHFALRKLYDPVGAWVERIGDITGTSLVILYILAHIIGGVSAMGGTYILAAIFGILAIVLTPTIIGLFIVYVIAKACNIPLLGAYFGVLLAGLIGVGVFFLGRGVGRLAMRIIAKVTALERKRVVVWG
jgi:hypothetical protein